MFLILYVLSFLMVMGCDEWILIWIGLEINMMSFIILIYQRNSILNIEACLKYFFIQSLGSALLLNFIYLNSELFSYFSVVVLSYKMGAGMFFFWFPSICKGIGWVSCFSMMTFQKLLPMLLMSTMVSWVVWLMVVVSLIVGSIGCMNQVNLKELMAYSSIHQIGWLMMCLIMDKFLWLFYLFVYMLVMIPIMLVMMYMNVYDVTGINNWDDKVSFVFSMMSMAGMPPLLGFVLKCMMFYYLSTMSFGTLVLLVVMSVLMFYIYVRIMYNLVMGKGEMMAWQIKNAFKFNYQIDWLNISGIFVGVLFWLGYLN